MFMFYFCLRSKLEDLSPWACPEGLHTGPAFRICFARGLFTIFRIASGVFGPRETRLPGQGLDLTLCKGHKIYNPAEPSGRFAAQLGLEGFLDPVRGGVCRVRRRKQSVDKVNCYCVCERGQRGAGFGREGGKSLSFSMWTLKCFFLNRVYSPC